MDKFLKDHKDELRTLILELNDEQLDYYFTQALEMNKFLEEMKKRLAAAIVLKGGVITGDEIHDALTAFAKWSEKQTITPKELHEEEIFRQGLEKLVLETPSGDRRNLLTRITNYFRKKENEARK